MENMSLVSLIISLASLIMVLIFYFYFKKISENILREIDHVDNLMPSEEVSGTDYVYCDGECSRVSRPNNKLKCRPTSCTEKGCSCQMFRRPKPVPEDWDGEYEHVGDGDKEHEKENGYSYMCWCVKEK